MTTQDQGIQAAYMFAQGKPVMPLAGTTKYVLLQSLLNWYIQQWATEQGVDWQSLYQYFTCTTTPTSGINAVVTPTDTFYLPIANISKISKQEGDFVRIVWTNGVQESDYTIYPITKLYDNSFKYNYVGGGYLRGRCAIVGSMLIFDTPFIATSPEIGGSIKVPGYGNPPVIANSTDPILIDDPTWAIYMSAAEMDRNDVTKQGNYGGLIAMATDVMQQMKEANLAQVEKIEQNWRPPGDLDDSGGAFS